LTHHHQDLLDEISQVVESISSVECLTKISEESAKVKRWGGHFMMKILVDMSNRVTGSVNQNLGKIAIERWMG
jgi:hypothetical protein